MAQRTWTDQQVEEAVGNLLRGGVMLAAVVVLLGGGIYLFRHGTAVPDYQVFHSEPADLRSVSGIIQDALALQGRAVIQCGLLILTATPIARVIFALVAFAWQRDRTYVLVTLLVLTVLLYSLTGGAL
jgi:uncharacterized membrane protein